MEPFVVEYFVVKIEPKKAINKPDQLLELVNGLFGRRLDEPIDAVFPVLYSEDIHLKVLKVMFPGFVIGVVIWLSGAPMSLVQAVVMPFWLLSIVGMAIFRKPPVSVVAVTPKRYLLLDSKAGLAQARIVSELPRSYRLPYPTLVGKTRSGITSAPIAFPGFENSSKSWRYMGQRTNRDESLYQHLRVLADEADAPGHQTLELVSESIGLVGSDPVVFLQRMRSALGPGGEAASAVYPLKPASTSMIGYVIAAALIGTSVGLNTLDIPSWARTTAFGGFFLAILIIVFLRRTLDRRSVVVFGSSVLVVQHDDELSRAKIDIREPLPSDPKEFLKKHRLEFDTSFAWVKAATATVSSPDASPGARKAA